LVALLITQIHIGRTIAIIAVWGDNQLGAIGRILIWVVEAQVLIFRFVDQN
jgi:hypothetical protein